MDFEEEKSLKDYLQVLRRRKYTIVVPMLILLLISLIVTIALPPVYRSIAVIQIEQQHIPSDLVQSTVDSLADLRIRQIQQKLMTIDNLNKIIQKFNLYSKERKLVNTSDLAEVFKEATIIEIIKADPLKKPKNDDKAGIAFTISFDYKVAVIAQKVANELVTLFLDENIRSRTQRAEESTKFLQDEAEKIKLEIQKTENQIAEFKDKFAGSLPELQETNINSISKIETQIQQLQLQEKMVEERKLNLNNQLLSTSPVVIDSSGKNKATEVQTKASIEAEYNALLQKYSSSHPDVKALKRKLENFQETGKDKTPEANNPLYLQLQSQINLANVELSNITQQKIKLDEQRRKLDSNVAQSHQVEREYSELMRDLENNKKKYNDLNSKYLSAKMSHSLEVEQKAEKFTLVEPPRIPEKPEKPNRLKILFAGFLFSIAGGIGCGFLAEALDNSIRGQSALTQIVGTEPLVVIPYLKNEDDFKRNRRNVINFSCLLVALFIGALIAIHVFYMPIDALLSQISDKMSSMF